MLARWLRRGHGRQPARLADIAWPVARLEALTPDEWERLATSHAAAGRAGPVPHSELSARGRMSSEELLEATSAAGDIAVRAVGEEASNGWRLYMVAKLKDRAGRPHPDDPRQPSRADLGRLFDRTWSYLSPAEWTAGYLAVRQSFSAPEWSTVWDPYRAVPGEPP